MDASQCAVGQVMVVLTALLPLQPAAADTSEDHSLQLQNWHCSLAAARLQTEARPPIQHQKLETREDTTPNPLGETIM